VHVLELALDAANRFEQLSPDEYEAVLRSSRHDEIIFPLVEKARRD
jgi:hypothetical protein